MCIFSSCRVVYIMGLRGFSMVYICDVLNYNLCNMLFHCVIILQKSVLFVLQLVRRRTFSVPVGSSARQMAAKYPGLSSQQRLGIYWTHTQPLNTAMIDTLLGVAVVAEAARPPLAQLEMTEVKELIAAAVDGCLLVSRTQQSLLQQRVPLLTRHKPPHHRQTVGETRSDLRLLINQLSKLNRSAKVCESEVLI